MANKYMKTSSNSLVIKEMQVKTTRKPVRNLTSVRNAVNQARNHKLWRECGEKGTLVHC